MQHDAGWPAARGSAHYKPSLWGKRSLLCGQRGGVAAFAAGAFSASASSMRTSRRGCARRTAKTRRAADCVFARGRSHPTAVQFRFDRCPRTVRVMFDFGSMTVRVLSVHAPGFRRCGGSNGDGSTSRPMPPVRRCRTSSTGCETSCATACTLPEESEISPRSLGSCAPPLLKCLQCTLAVPLRHPESTMKYLKKQTSSTKYS